MCVTQRTITTLYIPVLHVSTDIMSTNHKQAMIISNQFTNADFNKQKQSSQLFAISANIASFCSHVRSSIGINFNLYKTFAFGSTTIPMFSVFASFERFNSLINANQFTSLPFSSDTFRRTIRMGVSSVNCSISFFCF